MAKKKLQELRGKTATELVKFIAEKKLEVYRAQGQLSVGRHKNTRIVKNLRGEIAWAESLLREKGGKG